MKKLALVGCLAVLACSRPQPVAQQDLHYTVGPAWQAGGKWFYPREDFAWQGTGLAVREPAQAEGHLTADGEVWHAASMTGSHQTLQLPAVVRVTNLDNGRQIVIRLNDRGPNDPGRMIGLSPRAADLLGVGKEPARVQVVEDEMASRQFAEVLPGGPMLQISAAPLEKVQQTALGNAPVDRQGLTVLADNTAQETPAPGKVVLADLPATVMQGAPVSSMLWVETMDFTSRLAAMRQAAAQGASVRPVFLGHSTMWAVRYGPFATISEADAALKRALATGLTGSHIVVE